MQNRSFKMQQLCTRLGGVHNVITGQYSIIISKVLFILFSMLEGCCIEAGIRRDAGDHSESHCGAAKCELSAPTVKVCERRGGARNVPKARRRALLGPRVRADCSERLCYLRGAMTSSCGSRFMRIFLILVFIHFTIFNMFSHCKTQVVKYSVH